MLGVRQKLAFTTIPVRNSGVDGVLVGGACVSNDGLCDMVKMSVQTLFVDWNVGLEVGRNNKRILLLLFIFVG
jgi:hypothetical protein